MVENWREKLGRKIDQKIDKEKHSGNTVLETYSDGSIRFKPPFSKGHAEYIEPDNKGFDSSHKRCHSCTHYIQGGGCHLVQGKIDPQGYCGEFYADYGVFGHRHSTDIEENFELVGDSFDWTMDNIEDFVLDIRERLQQLYR